MSSPATSSTTPQRDSRSTSPPSDQSRNDAQLSMMSMLVRNLRNPPAFHLPQTPYTFTSSSTSTISRSYLPSYNIGSSDGLTASAMTNNSMIPGSLGCTAQGERVILPTSASRVDATSRLLLLVGLPTSLYG